MQVCKNCFSLYDFLDHDIITSQNLSNPKTTHLSVLTDSLKDLEERALEPTVGEKIMKTSSEKMSRLWKAKGLFQNMIYKTIVTTGMNS